MKDSRAETNNDAGDGSPILKPYTTPKFFTYGNISQITRAVAKTSAVADGGGPKSNNKTA